MQRSPGLPLHRTSERGGPDDSPEWCISQDSPSRSLSAPVPAQYTHAQVNIYT